MLIQSGWENLVSANCQMYLKLCEHIWYIISPLKNRGIENLSKCFIYMSFVAAVGKPDDPRWSRALLHTECLIAMQTCSHDISKYLLIYF